MTEYLSLEDFQAREAIFFLQAMDAIDELEAYGGGLYAAYLQYIELHGYYNPLGDQPQAEGAVEPLSFHDWMFGNDNNYLLLEPETDSSGDSSPPSLAAEAAEEDPIRSRWSASRTVGSLTAGRPA